ncbi:hypothetical protein DICPUDRAFT_157080 [Dictyostelium purpureum]|uniref:Fucosyltransferase n=1 Tax=Dictyostelium purpureum TaxID=5786 RepID=F0ZY76_DICPU|nr:uncharacterized protein DICPUDRAFT_157080 [Dictyostelium purpureum]EGC31093.1 hypothetical protein DICPUDRAFT_157080 [Dictyostelium purpureum]|eukprot:XP_003292370.1 hypothetical protein DICPUDRAFT_157080 [Dictyostelium purpureum]
MNKGIFKITFFFIFFLFFSFSLVLVVNLNKKENKTFNNIKPNYIRNNDSFISNDNQIQNEEFDNSLKKYPFQNIDKETRFKSKFFKLKTSMYNRFPEFGKEINYCNDLDGIQTPITFLKLYPSQNILLEIYFNHYFDFPAELIPEPPNPNIPRVLHSLEPPSLRICTENEKCISKFNWSVSYERIADIRVNHCDDKEIFQILPYELDKFVMNNKTQYIKSTLLKTNGKNNNNNSANNFNYNSNIYSYSLASWFCSKCDAPSSSNRLEYIKEMMKYIKIDSYGSCLNNIPVTNITSRLKEDAMDVKQSLMGKYKFYLAFENSNCIDYTTEKPLHALKSGSVPIIMAHPQTQKYLPEGSYIYAGDFSSAKELSDYLIYLDQNDDEYLKYFHWRFNQVVIEKWININGYPYRANSRTWICSLFQHYQKWERGLVPNKTLYVTPYDELCLPPNFIKIK